MADELTEKIIGAAIEVHRELGPGLLESIYEEALCYEFDLQEIKYKRQVPADIIYKGKVIKGQKIDLLVENALCLMLVEQPDKSAIRAKTRYVRSSPRLSQASSDAIVHLGPANEASIPAGKNYSCTL